MTQVRIEIDVDSPPKLVQQAMISKGATIGRLVAGRAKSIAPVGSITRAAYRRGRYAGSSWTSRSPGRLRSTIKGYKAKYTSKGMISVVVAGSNDAFYAFMVHAGTPRRGIKGKFYLKKARESARNEIETSLAAAIRTALK